MVRRPRPRECLDDPAPGGLRAPPYDEAAELVERAIENSSEAGDIVLDLFLGSGTTLTAAERTGRVCYGLEIDPHYCDVIVARWESFTGERAVSQNAPPSRGSRW